LLKYRKEKKKKHEHFIYIKNIIRKQVKVLMDRFNSNQMKQVYRL